MFVIVYSTVGSKREALKIARTLVQERLAACVNTFPITSVYPWEGKLCAGGEYALICKTTDERFRDVEKKIIEMHSYDLPCILSIPILCGSEKYLNWVKENVK